MKIYLISYDLKRPGQNYQALYDAIKKNSNGWCHCLESTWIVKSDFTITTIRDLLQKHIDDNDSIFIATLTGEAAWNNLATDVSNWLKQNL